MLNLLYTSYDPLTNSISCVVGTPTGSFETTPVVQPEEFEEAMRTIRPDLFEKEIFRLGGVL